MHLTGGLWKRTPPILAVRKAGDMGADGRTPAPAACTEVSPRQPQLKTGTWAAPSHLSMWTSDLALPILKLLPRPNLRTGLSTPKYLLSQQTSVRHVLPKARPEHTPPSTIHPALFPEPKFHFVFAFLSGVCALPSELSLSACQFSSLSS